MKGLTILFLFFFLLSVSFLIETGAAEAEEDGVYIVYMGAAVSANGSPKNDHTQLLNSVLKRRKNALVHRYTHGISGFAALLSAAEAESIAREPGVVSVFPDPVLQLHTTRSWDFLKDQTEQVIDSNPNSDRSSSSQAADTIIGILDTGIWPESESFNDTDMGPIPTRWKGTCMEGKNFNSSNCNRKLIGARFYNDEEDYKSPRDMIGHGTHVAATAGGHAVSGASYYGLAAGTAIGGSPGSRIAMYRVCTPIGCDGSSILAAFDDAIADGVDILSLSLGTPAPLMVDFKQDAIAIGAFHAVENGITVVCSAGNDGPFPGTVTNVAPWILTVGATTIDRDFESDVVLGNNKVIKGEAINFANIHKSPVNPLIDGKSAKRTGADDEEARNCKPDALEKDMVKGKIVVCESNDEPYLRHGKINELVNLGGIGVVLVNNNTRGVAFNFKEFPMTVISSKDAAEILSYINSNKDPVATNLPTTTVSNYTPAPTVPHFTSRGPSFLARNILKPDIAAPGVDILAAWIANDTTITPKGKEPPLFNVITGTSMACPHVSGMAAVVKSQYPTWSPSAIKSAIMTTASQVNNMKAPIRTATGAIANAFDYGAGEITTSGPLQPGLIYETTTIDYLNFLCYYGYDTSIIRNISKTVPAGFTCPKESSIDLISNINYPSMAVFNLTGKQNRNISRTVTNIAGDGDTTYALIMDLPSANGLSINVIPDKLQFKKNGERLSYQVIFSATVSSLQAAVFGSLTWTNGKFKVRSPFVVSS